MTLFCISGFQLLESLPMLAAKVGEYLWIQDHLPTASLEEDQEFRRRYCLFHGIRRNRQWQDHFFEILSVARQEPLTYMQALTLLESRVGRFEANIASKLIASVDPESPVLEPIALEALGVTLPRSRDKARIQKACGLHQYLRSSYSEFLETDVGGTLVRKFRESYADPISPTRILEFALVQSS